jgi:hypothetical protein
MWADWPGRLAVTEQIRNWVAYLAITTTVFRCRNVFSPFGTEHPIKAA